MGVARTGHAISSGLKALESSGNQALTRLAVTCHLEIDKGPYRLMHAIAELNDMITNFGKGNAALASLPRKINIGLSPSRDDFPHTHINDIGLVAAKHPETGEVGMFSPFCSLQSCAMGAQFPA